MTRYRRSFVTTQHGEAVVTFTEVLDQAIEMLQRQGRLTYGALKRQFNLDDAYLEDLKDELIYGRRLAREEAGRVLVWIGDPNPASASTSLPPVTSDANSEDTPSPDHLPPILTAPPDAERRQLTVMFCDLADSTRLSSQLDPEELREVIRAYQRISVEVIERFEGHVAQFLGDGILVYFGYPQAHEDDARRAVHAGLQIVEALQELNVHLERDRGLRLTARLGIHTGPVVVGTIGGGTRHEQLAMGETPNLAARIQSFAQPNTVLISRATYRLTSGEFSCHNLGAYTVKGIARPIQLYRILGSRSQAHAHDGIEPQELRSPLEGRQEEVASLVQCVGDLVDGRGGVTFVMGEVGVGKSRLLAEVRHRVEALDVLWLEGRAVSFGQTLSYWPFLDIIKKLVGITDHDDEATSWEKLHRQVATLFTEQVADVLPYLATLLALEVREPFAERVKYLDGQAMGYQIFRTMRHVVTRLTQDRPLVLVFEDLHWADHSSATLLEHLFPLVDRLPLLICGVSRPETQGPVTGVRQAFARTHPARYLEITLKPLTPVESLHLLGNFIELETLPRRLREEILNKAEGNPFFLEEIVRTLMDLGVLVRQTETTRWRATGPVDQLSIPDTIQGVIMARVDRLPEAIKEILRLAAVIGRSFLYRVLRSFTEDEADLKHRLGTLLEAELIREKEGQSELEYIFQHALVHEVTYESLLVQRRRELHHRVGTCIETLFPHRLDEFSGVLAYHFAQAEAWEKAHTYLFRAGDQAGKMAADVEALAHYHQAITVYSQAFGARWDPVQRAVLERKMGEALFRRGDHQQATEYIQKALSFLGSELPTSRWRVRLAILKHLLQQARHRLVAGLSWPGRSRRQMRSPPDPTAEEQARLYEAMLWIDYFRDPERFVLDAFVYLNFAERHGLVTGIVQGAISVGVICDILSRSRLADYYHRYAVAQATQFQHPLAIGYAYLGRGVHEIYLGQWEAALDHLWRSADAFLGAGYVREGGAAKGMVIEASYRMGGYARAQEMSAELVQLGQDGADHQVWGWGLYGLAQSELHIGEVEDVVAYLQQSIELLASVPDHLAVVAARGYLGRSYLRQGNWQQALSILEECAQFIATSGLRNYLLTPALNGLAEAYLAVAEQAEGAARTERLQQAKKACRAALRQGKVYRGGAPQALRLQGTCAWLMDQPETAKKWWQKSLAVAEALGMQYETGMAHLEVGRRLGKQEHLERAEAILDRLGARGDLAYIQQSR